uniref:ferroxidase n=1 Tax=Romanomermis culicivorax TaxID=13658 RepID=A0A915I0E2_ROMCU
MTSQLEDLMAAINKKYSTEKRKYLSEIGMLKRNLDVKELQLNSKGEEILRLRQENDGLRKKMAQFQRRCSNDFLDILLVKSNTASREPSTSVKMSTLIDSYCQTENFEDIIEKELQLRLEAFIRLYANEKNDPRNLRLESDGDLHMASQRLFCFRQQLTLKRSLCWTALKPHAKFAYLNSSYLSSSISIRLINHERIRPLTSGQMRFMPDKLTENQYHRLADETLESLCDYFEKLSDKYGKSSNLDIDVAHSMGVLTVSLVGSNGGIFVINKQTPNKQIWLSSPFSGPKRYDFCSGKWLYSHDGSCLHDLLTKEISEVFRDGKVDFGVCAYGK